MFCSSNYISSSVFGSLVLSLKTLVFLQSKLNIRQLKVLALCSCDVNPLTRKEAEKAMRAHTSCPLLAQDPVTSHHRAVSKPTRYLGKYLLQAIGTSAGSCWRRESSRRPVLIRIPFNVSVQHCKKKTINYGINMSKFSISSTHRRNKRYPYSRSK
jgi:hypothetical protein